MANKASRTKNARLNTLSSLLLQFVTAISGLIIPRIIIPTYGSQVNGLIASITQFLSYIALLEAGVGSVFLASLYKPLYANDMKTISGIINEQKRFYHKIGIVFAFYVILLLIIYPRIAITTVDRKYLIALIIILSIGTFVEYFVSLPYQCLIIADQMVRLINISAIIVIVLNLLLTTLLVSVGADIIFVKLSSCLIAILKPVVYVWYVKKHYRLDPAEKPNEEALRQRWNGLVHHISFYIHTNTDIVLLTIFVGTSTVSVYSIYLAVVTGVQKIITSLSSSIGASIGNLIADGNKKAIDKTMDQFELMQIIFTTVLFTITGMMLMPFIHLYTQNMGDAEYSQPIFGYILIAAEAIYCVRCIYTTVCMSGNKFKETQPGAILESAVNLTASIALLIILNTEGQKLIAIAIGTLLGMLTRLVFEVLYLRRGLIYRPVSKAIKAIAIYLTASFVSVVICRQIHIYECNSVIEWIGTAILTSLIVISCILLFSIIFYKKTLYELYERFTKKSEQVENGP